MSSATYLYIIHDQGMDSISSL
jgi:hypothetical protein